MARLGYLYKGDEGLVTRMDRLIDLASSPSIKRETIRYHMDRPVPYSQRYLGALDNHFSSDGVNGMDEMIFFQHYRTTDAASTCAYASSAVCAA